MIYTLCCAGVLFLQSGWAKAYSLTSFGRAMGFSSDLAMCMALAWAYTFNSVFNVLIVIIAACISVDISCLFTS